MFRECVFSFKYPPCNAHAPYYLSSVACPTLKYFPTLRFSGEKFVENKMCALIISPTFVRKIYHFKNNSERYKKCAQVFMKSALYSCQIFSNLNFLDRFSKRPKFHENPSGGSQVGPCGQTDRHEKLIVACCNFANASKDVKKTVYV